MTVVCVLPASLYKQWSCVTSKTVILHLVAEEYNVAIRAAQLIKFLIAITITDATIT